jgi:YggT family protein
MFFSGGCIEEDATALSETICLLFNLLTLVVFVRILLSWFNLDPSNPAIQALHAITEPILDPFRRTVPRVGMLDLSPIVALLVLRLLISPAFQILAIEAGI